MKRYFLLTVLFAICSLYTFADVTGETPATGTAYYLYNVGQQKYLNISGTGVTLSSTQGTQFTVAKGTESGTYTLTSTAGKLSTTKDGAIINCDGYYDNWKFTSLSTDDKTYALGVLEDEDNYSFSYIYYSSVLEEITKGSTMPEITNGQWLFTTSMEAETITYTLESVDPIDDLDYTATSATVYYTIHPSSGNDIKCNHVVTFEANDGTAEVIRTGSFVDGTYNVTVDWSVKLLAKPETSVYLNPFEDDYSYSIPENMGETVDVYFYITPLASGEKNPICVPFNMSYEQLKAAFGPNFRLYYYRSSSTKAIYYAARSEIQAGVPYIIVPDGTVSESDDEKAAREKAGLSEDDAQVIKVEGVTSSSFVSEPSSVTHGNWTLNATFDNITLTSGNYLLFDCGMLYRASNDEVPAFQAYLYSTNSSAVKVLPQVIYNEDDWSTDIDEIETPNAGLTIYNANGQLVRSNAQSTEGLPKGIYIVNGKKMMIK